MISWIWTNWYYHRDINAILSQYITLCPSSWSYILDIQVSLKSQKSCVVFKYLIFDSSLPEVEVSRFKTVNWTKIYGDLEEELPSNILEPRSDTVIILMFCDTSFAGNIITRRLQTKILIFINMAPMTWYSKKRGQNLEPCKKR